MKVRGRTWVFGDNVNTDLMYPGAAFTATPEERRRMVFQANRPGWVDLVAEGDILVAGQNFGTGSGRPAAQLLQEVGIRGIIAEGVNGLFQRNCVNYGLPVTECPGILGVVAEGDIVSIDFAVGLVDNETNGEHLTCVALPPVLLELAAEGGVIPRLVALGYLDPPAE